MKTLIRSYTTLLLTTLAAAQEPAQPMPTAKEPELQSLPALLIETIWTRQPTTNGGAAADTPFARVRDAEFTADGHLQHLIVTGPAGAKAPDGSMRVLAAGSVRWEPASRHWLVHEPTLQFAELPAHEPPRPDKDKKEPAITNRLTRVLASDLLRGEPAEPIGKVPAVEASGRKVAARIVWWFVPAAQQLATATFPKDGKHHVVPWAALRLEGNAEAPRVRIDSTAALDGAPMCSNADDQPSSAVRQQSYAHFGVKPPAWDTAAPPEKGKTEPDHGKGGGGE